MSVIRGCVIVFLVTFFLSGCVVTNDVIKGSFKYDESHSRAWNLIVAAKQDSADEKKVSSEYLKVSGNNLYYWGALNDESQYNLSRIDLSPLMLDRYPHAMSPPLWMMADNFFAWVPQEKGTTAESAQYTLVETIRSAASERYGKLWMKDTKTIIEDGFNEGVIGMLLAGMAPGKILFINMQFADERFGCQLKREKYYTLACVLSLKQQSSIGTYDTPSFLTRNQSGKSYLFSSIEGRTSTLSVGNMNAKSEFINQRIKLAILQGFSEKLPEWAFIYVAPNEKAGLPGLVLQQGVSYFFIR